jgi:beta-glucosidase
MILKKLNITTFFLSSLFFLSARVPNLMAEENLLQGPPLSQKDRFINDLISKMSVEEKIGQLTLFTSGMDVTGPIMNADYLADIKSGRVGSIFNAFTPRFTKELQTLAMENNPNKIPLLFAYDVIHGHRTIFPIPLAESSSWDLKLIQQNARVSAVEASADGLHWVFGPMVDIARDPRWGRVAEGAGEDPWLGSKVAVAKVRGLQGSSLRNEDSVAATVKHFAAYGGAQGGRDYNIVDMSERELFETYLPPYRDALKAGAATVMTSFNEINGVPATANSWLLNDLLRKKWAWDGMVLSDYTAVKELIYHGVAKDDEDAAKLALLAGVDMDMEGANFLKFLPNLVNTQGKEITAKQPVSMEELDKHVRRVLELKYKLGLFQNPYKNCDQDRADNEILSVKHRKQARLAARKSIVLLQNNNSILPLKKTGTVALIGPMVENKRDLIGNWSAAGDWQKAVSLKEAFENYLKQYQLSDLKLLYAKGANMLDPSPLSDFLNKHGGQIEVDEKSASDLIQEALSTAKNADVLVVALGETQGMSGEAASRSQIRLPENQKNLLRALAQTGKPIVLLLSNGRPLVLEEESNLATAMLETWFLGTESGRAIVDVLMGDYNPSGKLTVSFPYNEGQIPIYYSSKTTGRPFDPDEKYRSKYLDVSNEPLYPFGWGLSYTTFEYKNLKLSAPKITAGQKLKVSITLSNTGSYAGEETVQLYVRDLVASVTRPVKQLRAFKKVFLKAGESQELSMEISVNDLKFYNKNMRWVAEPGVFDVMVGGDSKNLIKSSFELE